jgi:hypothetical protein
MAAAEGRAIVDPNPRLRTRPFAVVSEREKIKQRTMRKRKKEYLAAMAA